ncbi:MAG: right-handed parallel beta-helix repeat-containing protein, partial [Ilumatobacter sp.]|uniref:right-handed parallel beta-helix repeat-containing protein n=1 Tax=Ilumatobacter sp. TaxID=1967498 RepID=UPI003C726DCA
MKFSSKMLAFVAAVSLVVAACGGSGGSNRAEVPVESGEIPDVTEAPAPTTADTDPPATDAADATEPAATDAPEPDPVPVEAEVVIDGDADGILNVPDEYPSIQAGVDSAVSGDLVLIAPGVYNEAVNVVTDEIVIRGLEREGVVLDGEFELDNGIRVLGAKGVAVENLTTQNYTDNGVFFTSADGYRASYITAYRIGDYGIYAFDSVNGQIEHSYGAGSPDAGFYIGQCYPCNAVMDDVLAEHNGLGYSGTNAGGNLTIVNSTFRNNRAGVVPNSGSYELCYPQRQNMIVGNTIYSNNQPDTPAIDVALLAMGNGVVVAGGIGNTVERNLIYDHDKTGIALTPFLEEGANDDLPSEDEWAVECAEQRLEPLADDIPDALLWEAYDNVIRDNDISDSGVADLGVEGVEVATGDLRNCWSGNAGASSAPADLET